VVRTEQANRFTARLSFQSGREVLGQSLAAWNFHRWKTQTKFGIDKEDLISVPPEHKRAASLPLGLFLRFHDLAPFQCRPFVPGSSSR